LSRAADAATASRSATISPAPALTPVKASARGSALIRGGRCQGGNRLTALSGTHRQSPGQGLSHATAAQRNAPALFDGRSRIGAYLGVAGGPSQGNSTPRWPCPVAVVQILPPDRAFLRIFTWLGVGLSVGPASQRAG
jgi:hypothetical protein